MKNFAKIYCLALTLLIVALSSSAQQRTTAEIMQIVAQSTIGQQSDVASMIKDGAGSRGYNAITSNLKSSSTIIGQIAQLQTLPDSDDAATRASTLMPQLRGGAEAFYIYQASKGGSFVIVSADKRMPAVLGYGNKGIFDADSMPTNFMACLLDYAATANALNNTITTSATSPALADENSDPNNNNEQLPTIGNQQSVGPLLTTSWGQSYPYNSLCPYYSEGKQSVTGCVATSMAQVMNYHRFPASGQGENSYTTSTYGIQMSKDFSATTFDWGNYQDAYPTTGVATADAQAIGELMLTCGISVDMDYGSSSSSSQILQMAALAKHFGYDNDMVIAYKDYMPIEQWHSLLKAELDAQRPLLISGATPSGYGHAFILDGYTSDQDADPFYHVNWGWRGTFDGDFKITNLVDQSNNNQYYSQRIAAIINMQPDNGVEEYPNYIQIQSAMVEHDNIDVTAGEQLLLDINTCINGSNKAFNGTVTFYLQDTNDLRTAIYTINLLDMPSGYFHSSQVECTLPPSLESGKYIIAATAKNHDSDQEYDVSICHTNDSIIITNDPTIYYPLMMSTDIAVNKTDNRAFSLVAQKICNFSEIAFTGTLKMMVTDYYRNFINTFGTTRSIINCGKFSYLTSPFSFNGILDPALPDGAYRIYLGAQQSGYNSWGKVNKYVLINNYISDSGIDGGTKFWLSNGHITMSAPYVMGDANQDDEIDVSDMSALVRMILDNYTTLDYAFIASDLDENGLLNVGDFSKLVKEVINAANQEGMAGTSTYHQQAATDRLDIVQLENQSITNNEQERLYKVNILLNNQQQAYNALQADITLDEGSTLITDSITCSTRAKGFKVVYSGNRLLLYNLQDANFEGQEGAIASLWIKTQKEYQPASHSITLNNIILSSSDNCQSVKAKALFLNLGESDITAINNTNKTGALTLNGGKGILTLCSAKDSVVTIYDMKGKNVATISLKAGHTHTVSMPAGIYIIGKEKIIIK